MSSLYSQECISRHFHGPLRTSATDLTHLTFAGQRHVMSAVQAAGKPTSRPGISHGPMMGIFEQIHAHPAERITGQILCILAVLWIIAAMNRSRA